MSSLKSLLLLTTVGCFYAKGGDAATCRVVLYWVILEERLSVRVLASAVDDSSTQTLFKYNPIQNNTTCCHITTLSVKTSNCGQ